MSEQEARAEYGTNEVIPSDLADAIRQEMLNSIKDDPDLLTAVSTSPWTTLQYTEKTRDVHEQFLKSGDKETLARMMKVPAERVADRFYRAFPVIFRNTTTLLLKGGLPNRVWTFVAFGKLTFENGLPALGPSKVKHKLDSGFALHVRGDVDLLLSGLGGGTALMIDWKIY
ncbi:hypothetical protein GP486_000005 [Trichoglossum hirsutum]|uniref:Uncharacterized protein n=1 Tax=Trichoglossum hirsutum TaxID=265104 RepID=A0A9P8LIJ5_9PEZI|nr:hypothetical protein GP486_000005 [Trichoglossum hirsutum]